MSFLIPHWLCKDKTNRSNTQITAMSMQWKQSVLSIKDKQMIISGLEKGERGTNLVLKFKISKQQTSDPEIHRQRRDEWRTENTLYTYSPYINSSKSYLLSSFPIITFLSQWLIFIFFYYLDSRLSGLLTQVPTSPDNRGSTIYYIICTLNCLPSLPTLYCLCNTRKVL